MKKFCSSCGNQLELSQRFCGQCGTVNPFFVAAFTLLSDQSELLEKLRLEKERIDKELQEKEDAQKEFERQEQIRKQNEEAEVQKLEKLAREKAQHEQAERLKIEESLKREIQRVKEETQKEFELQEQLRKQAEEQERGKAERLVQERIERENAEREKIEANLKKEILQVKEEAEQYKKETINLVREVRNEVKGDISQIEEENKRLKQEVESLSKNIPEKKVKLVAPPVEESALPDYAEPQLEREKKNRSPLLVVLTIVFLMGGFLIYFYFSNIKSEQVADNTSVPETEAPVVNRRTERVVDTVLKNEEPLAANNDTAAQEHIQVIKAVLNTTNKPAAAPVAAMPVASPARANFTLSPAKIMRDLTGKRVSGCGVTIARQSDMESIKNLVQVEKTASYIKYKCTIRIVQGGDSYTATPYLYYTEDGIFIKIDGTTCE